MSTQTTTQAHSLEYSDTKNGQNPGDININQQANNAMAADAYAGSNLVANGLKNTDSASDKLPPMVLTDKLGTVSKANPNEVQDNKFDSQSNRGDNPTDPGTAGSTKPGSKQEGYNPHPECDNPPIEEQNPNKPPPSCPEVQAPPSDNTNRPPIVLHPGATPLSRHFDGDAPPVNARPEQPPVNARPGQPAHEHHHGEQNPKAPDRPSPPPHNHPPGEQQNGGDNEKPAKPGDTKPPEVEPNKPQRPHVQPRPHPVRPLGFGFIRMPSW